jgi:ethanolamine utilization protein EutQ (cupin superfamily)
MIRYRVEFDPIPWEEPLAGMRCKTLRQADRQLRLVEYTPAMQPHWCERGHIGYVLAGEFEIRFERKTEIFRAGDGVFIPAGPDHRHMGVALSERVRIIFVEEIAR